MPLTQSRQAERSERIAHVSSQLLTRVALLTRLLTSQLGGELSRTELGLLSTLSDRPRRITELAELERLKQPTMTVLVQRLEQQGLVSRRRHADDGRVVLANLTKAGSAALEDYRTRARAALGAHLAEMPDEQVEALAAATDTLAQLVALLQRGPSRWPRPRSSHSWDSAWSIRSCRRSPTIYAPRRATSSWPWTTRAEHQHRRPSPSPALADIPCEYAGPGTTASLLLPHAEAARPDPFGGALR